jgi:hypothetical protein
MTTEERYGLKSFKRDFPNEEACLQFLFDSEHTRKCSCGGQYRLIDGRKQFQCSKCRFQIAPCAGTIFHKSSTPLTLWFHAIWIFSNAKSGVSAKEMERQLEVTYKTAWRILHLIRKALKQSGGQLKGDIEMDSAYFGGRAYGGKYNKYQKQAIARKSVVMAAVERNGQIRAEVVEDNSERIHREFINRNVEKDGSRLLTDKSHAFKSSITMGLKHESVNHSRREWARGDVHTNRIETFWSHIKRSIKGTHKAISKKYLQEYLDAFVFHYNNRYSDRERFGALVYVLSLT